MSQDVRKLSQEENVCKMQKLLWFRKTRTLSESTQAALPPQRMIGGFIHTTSVIVKAVVFTTVQQQQHQ